MSPKKGKTGRGLSKSLQQHSCHVSGIKLQALVTNSNKSQTRVQWTQQNNFARAGGPPEREWHWLRTLIKAKLESSGLNRIISPGQEDRQNNMRLMETQRLRLPDESQEGRNRSWVVEEFPATL
ncbi:hypothetical protein T265_07889 [Opisthorchis viverrini]|uniref:Uncharacterized protein n=1 Tax=Opisthorchis viverrini TaxID=6198 RepID=A0A074ZBF9_OPIVI|nr:hypothetical protein T265_07889 [Opisthorchis viverrini]KER24463.1 hypothetical protein T265_07889 [Opisthorchis viverrini]